MLNFLKKHYPLILSLGFLWIVVTILFSLSISKTNGVFTYVIDDSYIHLSLAKNFVQTGVLGINPGEFSFCTSSPLWTIMLFVCIKLAGNSDLFPFWLNLFFASIVVVEIYVVLSSKIKLRSLLLTSLILTITAAPLHALIFTGLEHLLHISLFIPLIFTAARIINDKKNYTEYNKNLFVMILLSAFTVAARYESMFAVLIISAFLLYKKKLAAGLLNLVSGISLISIVGIYSVSQGGSFFPTSILLKGNIPTNGIGAMIKSVFYTFFPALAENAHILVIFSMLAVSALLIYAKVQKFNHRSIILTVIALLAIFFHLQTATVGWFYRYEAYLIVISLLVTIGNASEIRQLYREKLHYFEKKSIKIGFAVITIILLSPLFNRGIESFNRVPFASKNINNQQVLISRFCSEFLSDKLVAVNDIGAISYYSGAKIFDLWGLSNKDVFVAKREKKLTPLYLSELIKKNKIKYAVFYESWYEAEGSFFNKWIKCGSWKIKDNYVCGDDKVSFYASDSLTAEYLESCLKKFSRKVPADVFQAGNYLN